MPKHLTIWFLTKVMILANSISNTTKVGRGEEIYLLKILLSSAINFLIHKRQRKMVWNASKKLKNTKVESHHQKSIILCPLFCFSSKLFLHKTNFSSAQQVFWSTQLLLTGGFFTFSFHSRTSPVEQSFLKPWRRSFDKNITQCLNITKKCLISI